MEAHAVKDELERRIRAERRVAVIINAQSRRGQRLGMAAIARLEAADYAVSGHFMRNPLYLRRRIEGVVAEGYQFIILGGGDGTISSSTYAFAERDLVLGILPLGTGNSFARSLGIPLTLSGALDVLLQGKVADVDLGKVGRDYFANIVDIGLSGEMAWGTPRALKRALGVFAYVYVGLRLLWRHRPFLARFTSGGDTRVTYTHEIIIANGRYYGESLLGGSASVENRRLVVYTMEAVSRWQLARLWLAFLLRKRVPLAGMPHFETRAVTVETEPPQYIDLDGEETVRTPAHFTVAPNALYVMVPREFADQ
ncbi:MAG: Diacylglycerol kinase [bacterium ADurb.Bin429]|nr:MAG: Diacylglycerol kinase [bacterium ADurb.Bin429]